MFFMICWLFFVLCWFSLPELGRGARFAVYHGPPDTLEVCDFEQGGKGVVDGIIQAYLARRRLGAGWAGWGPYGPPGGPWDPIGLFWLPWDLL